MTVPRLPAPQAGNKGPVEAKGPSPHLEHRGPRARATGAMESFTESLNRLKEVHENEVLGEYLGEDKLSTGQQSKGQGQARGLPHVASNSRQNQNHDLQAQKRSPDLEPRAAIWPGTQP